MKRKLGGARARIGAVVGLAALLLAGPSAAWGQTVYSVNTTADVVGVPGQLSIRAAFDAANADGDDSVIVLVTGQTYTLSICGAFTDHGTNAFGALVHHAPEDLTLVGNGATIVQTCAGERVMRSAHEDATLFVEDLTLTGGDVYDVAQGPNLEPTGGGGGLSVFGSVQLTGVTLTGNHSEQPGGGLRALGQTVIYQSTITGNTAHDGAGGADVGLGLDFFVPHLTLVDSVVSDNSGNGLTLRYGTNVIQGSTISGHEASGIFADHGIHEVSGSTLTGNGGRGISGLDARITFTGGTASGNGLGGLSSTGSGFVDVSASTVSDNGSHGIEFLGCNASENRDNVIVTDATVSGNGGIGILHSGCGFTVVESVLVSENTGGIACNGCERTTVTSTTLTANAPQGGILYAPGFDFFGGPLTVSESLIADNASEGAGGGIRAVAPPPGVQASVLVMDSTISGNVAAGDGGGLYSEVGTTLLRVGLIENETVGRAAGDGGGAFVTGANLWVFFSTVSGNTAAGDGGGLALRVASPVHTLEVSDSTVSGNHAAGQGGGLFGLATNLLALRVELTDNTSVAQGAGFAGLDTSATFFASTVSGNVASAVGGGMYVRDAALPGSEIFVYHSTFSGNAAPSGGGIFADLRPPGTVYLENSTVSGNAGSGIEAALTTVVDLDASTLVGNAPHNLVLGAGGSLATTQSVIAASDGGPDCVVPLASSGGYNFDGDGTCGLGGGLGDVSAGGDPGLGPLQDNGGPTLTHAPLPGSPLQAMVPPQSCSQDEDQRFFERPGGTGCEPGAVETGVALGLPGDLKTIPGFPNRLDIFRLLPPGTFDPDSLQVIGAPTTGRLDLDPAEGVLVYTAPVGFLGEDAFTYRICWTADPSQCLDVEVRVEVRPSSGRVSGGGLIDAGGRPLIFAVAAHQGPVRAAGTCVFVDPLARVRVVCNRILGVLVDGEESVVFATGWVDGVPAHIRIDALDGGGPGGFDDHLLLMTSTGYAAEGPVIVGRLYNPRGGPI